MIQAVHSFEKGYSFYVLTALAGNVVEKKVP
jgi:hypothetical protein